MITERVVDRVLSQQSERWLRWVLGETVPFFDGEPKALSPRGVTRLFLDVALRDFDLGPLRRFDELELLALNRARREPVLPARLKTLVLLECNLLEEPPPVETLALAGTWDPGLCWGDERYALKTLHLESTFIPGGAWFDTVEALTLSQPWSQGSDPRWVPESDALRTLRLCHCLYQRDLDFVSRWPRLRELVYDACTTLSLAPLRQLRELEALTLTFGGDHPEIEALAELPRLRSLGFPAGTLTRRSLEVIAALPGLRALELGEATCDGRPITPDALPDSLRAITTFSRRLQS